MNPHFEIWLRENTILSESTIRQYVSMVKSNFEIIEDGDVDKINQLLIREWKSKNSNCLKPAVIYYFKYKNKFSNIYRLTKLKKKPRKKSVHFLTIKEIETLFINLPKKIRLLFVTEFRTASRVREIITLRKSNLDFVNGKYRVRLMTKGNQEKYFFIDKNLYNRLISINPKYEDYLFIKEPATDKTTYNFESLIRSNYNRINEIINSVSEKCLDKKVSTHDLRRSIANYIVFSEKDFKTGLKKAQVALGHANWRTTFIYLNDLGVLNDNEPITFEFFNKY